MGQNDFILDGIYVIAEIKDGDVTNYIRGLCGIIYSKDKKGTKTYYVTNNHGDVTALVNSSGTIIKEYTYDELQSLTLANAKKRKAVLTFDDNTYTVPLASEKQGDKLASFLKRKNDSIKLDGFNEIALNQLHDIDASV